IGPVTITTDPKKFQYELRELYVQGGGDCPEMSIGAIKIALEISLPGSFIYVFTDARSKDYRLTHEVLQLIQQKQSQVVFVLTGDCDDRTHIGYKVYEEIASTSSGQVFHLDKKQVNEVLKWVEEAVQASKVHLLSTDHLEQAVNTWKIPFDPSLKEVTVSLSGPSPVIEIRNPLGKLIKKGFGLNELLNIHNSAKVVNVKEPEAGMWTVKTSSSGRHSVRITGLSTIDFRAGFSRKPTLDFKKTVSRPVQGIPTYVLLNTSGISTPARIDLLELLNISGSSLKTIPVKYYPDRKPYGIWNVSDFVPPNEAFFLKVTGYDEDDYLFQRVSSVSFSSIVPDAPKVTMPEKTPGYYLQPGQIPCSVDSLLPFTLSFVRNGVTLGVDQYLKESASVNLDIEKVTLSDEDFYECIAVSSAGTGRAQTFFDVSEPPPVIQVPRNVTVTPGETAVLTCLIISAVDYNLTWQRNDRDVRLAEPARIRTLTNLSLELKSVKFNDAGEYHCMVSSEGGSSACFSFPHSARYSAFGREYLEELDALKAAYSRDKGKKYLACPLSFKKTSLLLDDSTFGVEMMTSLGVQNGLLITVPLVGKFISYRRKPWSKQCLHLNSSSTFEKSQKFYLETLPWNRFIEKYQISGTNCRSARGRKPARGFMVTSGNTTI
ncbi:hypothetical protein H8959_018595, partial [Pygathrix nigripes]